MEDELRKKIEEFLGVPFEFKYEDGIGNQKMLSIDACGDGVDVRYEGELNYDDYLLPALTVLKASLDAVKGNKAA